MHRFAIAVLAMAAFGAPAAADAFKLSYPAVNASFAAYFVAADKGYFRDEDLDVDLVQLPDDAAAKALAAGDIAYTASVVAALNAILHGARLKVILVGQSRPVSELWSFDPAVKRLEDLKGKTIALAARGGTDELALRLVMSEHGLKPGAVTLAPLGAPTLIAALRSGAQANGIIDRTGKTALQLAGILGKGKLVVDFHNDVRLQTGGLATSDAEIAVHHDRVARVLRAVWKATLYVMTQRDGVVAILRKREPKADPDAVAVEVDAAIADVEETGVMPEEAAKRELAVRAELAGIAPSRAPPPDQVYDFGFVHQAIAEVADSGWRPR